MVKRKLRLRLKKERFEAGRSKTKNKLFVEKLEKTREIMSKDNIKVEVKLTRSLIGKLPSKVRTIQALGLKKIGDKKIHTLNNAIKGMLNETINMIIVNEVK